jgi:hypothetical protein
VVVRHPHLATTIELVERVAAELRLYAGRLATGAKR